MPSGLFTIVFIGIFDATAVKPSVSIVPVDFGNQIEKSTSAAVAASTS